MHQNHVCYSALTYPRFRWFYVFIRDQLSNCWIKWAGHDFEGTHLFYTAHGAYQSKNEIHEVKRTEEELRDTVVARHRSI